MNNGVIVSVVLFAVLISAILSRYLKPPKPSAIGIDLGTTFSTAAIFNTGVGDVLLPTLFESDKIVPSTIAFERSSGAFVVGKLAERLRETDNRNVFSDMKRFIGRRTVDQDEFYDALRYPFTIVRGNSSAVAIPLPSSNSSSRTTAAGAATGTTSTTTKRKPLTDKEEDDEADVEAAAKVHVDTVIQPLDALYRFAVHGAAAGQQQLYYAHELSAKLLGYLRTQLSAFAGRPVDSCVIGVPVNFDASQRHYTRVAAELAGLRVLELVSEPTLAAMAYGLHERSNVHLVIVYDLGGGTLDVSLLEKQTDRMFYVLDSYGDVHFGGQDFNHAVFAALLATLSERDANDESLRRVLREEVERAKCLLNSGEADDAERRGEPLRVVLGEGLLRSAAGAPLVLSRALFDQYTAHITARAVAPLSRVLEPRNLTLANIDQIVMIGGSSRLRAVRSAIAGAAGLHKLHTTVPPDHVRSPHLASRQNVFQRSCRLWRSVAPCWALVCWVFGLFRSLRWINYYEF